MAPLAVLRLLHVLPPAPAARRHQTTLHAVLHRGAKDAGLLRSVEGQEAWPVLMEARPREAAGLVAARVVEQLSRLADLGLLLAEMSAERVVFCRPEGPPAREVQRLEAGDAASAARPADRTWRAFEARRALLLALPLAALAVHVASAQPETAAAGALRPFREALSAELQDLLGTFTVPLALARETFDALTAATAAALGRHVTLAGAGASGAAGDVLAKHVLERFCGVRFVASLGEASALGTPYDGTLRSPRAPEAGPTYLSLDVLQWSPPTRSAERFRALAHDGRVVIATSGHGDGDDAAGLERRERQWLEDTRTVAAQALHAAQLRELLDAEGGVPSQDLRIWARDDLESARAFVAHAFPPLETAGLLAFAQAADGAPQPPEAAG